MRFLLVTLLALAAGFFLRGLLARPPEPVYRDVFVPVEVIETVERVDTIIQWRERIVYRTLEPETQATAPQGAKPDVASFCAEAVATALATVRQEEEVPAPDPLLLLRSVRTERGWFFQPDRIIATGPLSNGDLRQFQYLAQPGWQMRTHGDSLIVQSPRFGKWRTLLEFVVVGGIGYGIGRAVD